MLKFFQLVRVLSASPVPEIRWVHDFAWTGIWTWKAEPAPTLLPGAIVPPCISAIQRAMANPGPRLHGLGPSAVYAEKPLKNILQCCFGNSYARITHRNLRLVSRLRQSDLARVFREEPGKRKTRSPRAQELARRRAQEKERQKKGGLLDSARIGVRSRIASAITWEKTGQK
jgi:hypothetical protein